MNIIKFQFCWWIVHLWRKFQTVREQGNFVFVKCFSKLPIFSVSIVLFSLLNVTTEDYLDMRGEDFSDFDYYLSKKMKSLNKLIKIF